MNKVTKDLIKSLVVEALQEKKAVVSEGKISKSALQQIIKEEYAALANEGLKGEPTGDEPMRGGPYDVAPATVGLPHQANNRKIAAEVETLSANLVKNDYQLAAMVGNLPGVVQNAFDFKNNLQGILGHLTRFRGEKPPEKQALIDYLKEVLQ
jgi:hypothetical protein